MDSSEGAQMGHRKTNSRSKESKEDGALLPLLIMITKLSIITNTRTSLADGKDL